MDDSVLPAGDKLYYPARLARARRRAALIAVLVAAIPAFGAPSALAGVHYRIVGKGWGHGIGLSQYGAKGFADRGSSAADIVSHYYRGTSLGPVPEDARVVSVLLTQGRSELVYTIRGAATATSPTGATTPLAIDDVVSIRIAGGTAIAKRIRGGETAELSRSSSGQVLALTGPDGSVRADFSTDGGARRTAFRGTQIVQWAGGGLGAINRVAIDSYLKGVVPSEVPTSWPASALQAQALAARSYAIATRKPGRSFDMYADTRSQVYRGMDEEESPTSQAVESTAGQAILYNGTVIPAFFSSTSGGRTAAIQDVWNSAPRPYLVSVPDPYERSPYSSWPERIAYGPRELASKLGISGHARSVDVALNGSQRVEEIKVRTGAGTTSVSGTTAQYRLGLRSTFFRIERLELAVRARRGNRVVLAGSAPSSGNTELWARPAGGAWIKVRQLQPVRGAFRTAVRVRSSTEYRIKRAGWFGPGVKLAPVT